MRGGEASMPAASEPPACRVARSSATRRRSRPTATRRKTAGKGASLAAPRPSIRAAPGWTRPGVLTLRGAILLLRPAAGGAPFAAAVESNPCDPGGPGRGPCPGGGTSSMATRVRPLQDRVIVKRVEEQEQRSAGGIIIPDTAKEKPQEGREVAVGPGKEEA